MMTKHYLLISIAAVFILGVACNKEETEELPFITGGEGYLATNLCIETWIR